MKRNQFLTSVQAHVRCVGIWALTLLSAIAIAEPQANTTPWTCLIPGHWDNCTGATYSEDGQWIVTADRNGRAFIWSKEGSKPVRQLRGQTNLSEIRGFSLGPNLRRFSPDNRYCAVMGFNGTSVFDTSTGRQRWHSSFGHGSSSAGRQQVAFAPNGTFLAVADSSIAYTEVRLFEPRTGAVIRSLIGHAAAVDTVAITKDSQRVLTGSSDGTTKLFDATTGAVLRTFAAGGSYAIFSPDDAKVASVDADGKRIHIFDALSGSLLRTLPGNGFSVVWMEFSRDGTKLLQVSSGSSSCSVWDVATGGLLRKFTDLAGPAAFAPNGLSVVGAYGNAIRARNIQTDVLEFSYTTGANNAPISMQFSPDGSELLLACNKAIYRFDADPWAVIPSFPGGVSICNSLRFSPDSTRVVSANSDGGVRVWNAATGDRVCSILGVMGTSAEFSPDGAQVLSPVATYSWALYDSATGAFLSRASGGGAQFAHFSPTGDLIVSTANTGSSTALAVWFSAFPSAPLRTFAGPAASFRDAIFSPNEALVAAGASDDKVRIYDIATGQLVHELSGHTCDVTDLQFSPDGTKLLTFGRVVSGSTPDQKLYVWDVSTGSPVRLLEGKDIKFATFANRNDRIVTSRYNSDSDGVIEVVDLASGAVLSSTTVGGSVLNGSSSANGGELITVGMSFFGPSNADMCLRTWSLPELAETQRFSLGYFYGYNTLYTGACSFSPNGQYLAGISSPIFSQGVLSRDFLVTGTAPLVGFAGSTLGKYLEVEVWQNGSLVETLNANYGADFRFGFTPKTTGAATLRFKAMNSLAKTVPVTLGAQITDLEVPLLLGDIDDDNVISVFDYLILSENFDTEQFPPNGYSLYEYSFASDLDGDGAVGLFDYLILSDNFDKSGEE